MTGLFVYLRPHYNLTLKKNDLFMFMSVHVCAWCLPKPEEGGIFFGTEIPGGCWLPCQCQEKNLGPLQEELVLPTAEPLLQPLRLRFLTHGVTVTLRLYLDMF